MDKERTSILLEKDVMLRLKTLAKITNKSTSFIIREAVTEYVTKKTPKKKFNIIGIVNSGDTQFAENDEEYLKNNYGKD
ncbi:MAG TPA: ribbon-helix-helix protein, CopG family [Candidatus Humimicrobiaceae bacterium]|jgi:predicted DNA-binding protein|nr:ribbon-helix-helix protein, CopG family [Candidatus Humimicrobiaceae bacterium]